MDSIQSMSLWDFFRARIGAKLSLKMTESSGISEFVEELQYFVKQINTVLEEYLSWTNNDRKTSVILAIESLLLSLQDLADSIPQNNQVDVGNSLVPERLLFLFPTQKIQCKKEIKVEQEDCDTDKMTCSNCQVRFTRKRHLQQHRCPQDWSRAQWATLMINGKKKFACAFKGCPTGVDAPDDLRQVWSKTSKVWVHFDACHATEQVMFRVLLQIQVTKYSKYLCRMQIIHRTEFIFETIALFQKYVFGNLDTSSPYSQKASKHTLHKRLHDHRDGEHKFRYVVQNKWNNPRLDSLVLLEDSSSIPQFHCDLLLLQSPLVSFV